MGRPAGRVGVHVEDVEVDAAFAVAGARSGLVVTLHAEQQAGEAQRPDRVFRHRDRAEPGGDHQVRRVDRLDRRVEAVDQRPVEGRRDRRVAVELRIEEEAQVGLVEALPVLHAGQAAEVAAVAARRGDGEGGEHAGVGIAGRVGFVRGAALRP